MARIAMSHNGEFATLYQRYNSVSAMMDVNGPAFTLPGYWHVDTKYGNGNIGDYWSSTTSVKDGHVLSLSILSSSLDPSASFLKKYGFPARCINNN